MHRNISCLALLICAWLLSTCNALAAVEPLHKAWFIVDGEEVNAGTFDTNVLLKEVSFGDVSFDALLGELIEPHEIRIYIDPHGNRHFQPIGSPGIDSDEYPVSFIAPEDELTDQEMQGIHLGQMMRTNGTVDVRMDVFFSSPLSDNSPYRHDDSPEAIIVGNFHAWHNVRVAAIVDGTPDNPVLASDMRAIDPATFLHGRTQLVMASNGSERTLPLSFVGLDLFGDFGVEPGTDVIGYRIEVSWGAPAMFTVLGAQRRGERSSITTDILDDLTDDPLEDFIAGTFGSGRGGIGGRSGQAGRVPQPTFRSGGFRGGGGGGGGGGLPRVDRDLPRVDLDDDDSPSSPSTPDPVIPAPGTLPILLLMLAGRSRRRQRTRC